MHVDNFVEVVKVNDISPGHMKHFELDGKEILIANVEGRFYAMDDRCGHMNALLSMGNLKDTTLICGFHGTQFEVTTGKKIGEPKARIPGRNETLATKLAEIFGVCLQDDGANKDS